MRGEVKWDRDAELQNGHGKGVVGQQGDGAFLQRGRGEVLVGRAGIDREVRGMGDGERKAWMGVG